MPASKEFVATLTSKGQVTIPVEIREQLGLGPQDKIIFRLDSDNRVEMRRMPMSLAEAYGSVPPLTRPEQLEEIKRIAKEERAERWLGKAQP